MNSEKGNSMLQKMKGINTKEYINSLTSSTRFGQ